MPLRGKMVGKIFDSLTVLEYDHSENRGTYSRAYWKCRCECGNIKIIRTDNLTRGKTRSCGCLPNLGNPGYRTSIGYGAFNKLFHNYKKSAKDRGLAFELSKDDVKSLMAKPCEYCGSEPMSYYEPKNVNGGFIYNGIDRVDSSKGYIHDNVVPCCGFCNRAKIDLSVDEFKSWIKRLIEYQKEMV